MSSLIFFIFMIWFIMRIVKNKQKATGQTHGKHLFHSGRQSKKIRL